MESQNRAELTDSILHDDIVRVFAGVVCGFAAGILLLLLTILLPPAGSQGMWWPQLLASIFYGGEALAYTVAFKVVLTGLVLHFALSCLCGFIVGKLTQTQDIKRLMFYGFVLGLLCWLATNMFGPNFINRDGLRAISQWYRGFIYVGFGVFLGISMGIAGRALKN